MVRGGLSVLGCAHKSLVGTLLVLTACSERPSWPGPGYPAPTLFSADTLDSYALDGEVVIDSDSLGRPRLIAVGTDRIYLGDRSARQVLQVYDRYTGEYILSAGPRGEGAGEIRRLWAIDFKPGSDAGWLYEFRTRVMHFFNGDSLTGETVRLSEKTGAPLGLTRVEGDSIAAVGMFRTGRLAIYDSAGDFARFVGPTPPGDPETPVPVRQHAFQALARTNLDSTRTVIASRNTDLIEIYDSAGLLYIVRGPRFNEPEYTLYGDSDGNSWLGMNDENIISYVDLTASNELIFALYSGESIAEFNSSDRTVPVAGTVFVFTWSGNPIAVLEIANGALYIGISEDGRDLYAIYRSPVPMILRYEVPEITG